MEMKIRNKDVFSGEDDLESLYTLKNFPVYMGVTDGRAADDLYADMEWGISESSGMLQLLKLVPEEILYHTSHNGSIGKLWNEHHTEFAEFLHDNMGSNAGAVLEIGGGNGILNAVYSKKYGTGGQWVIVEPSSVEPVDGCSAQYIRKIWDATFDGDDLPETGCLVHSHVLEHLYDLEGFMMQCETLLENGKRMIFSVPNLKETLARKYTNALNFEHTYFISEDYVEEILRRHSFRILGKKYFREDHSIFYVTEKCEGQNSCSGADFPYLYEQNRRTFLEFTDFHQKLISDLNEKMKQVDSDVYLFGAHIFSQYLIHFGLDISGVKCVLDNDEMKQGKRLYGTELTVSSPRILAREKNPVVILRVANYAEEIKKEIVEQINPNTVFWE